MLQCNAMQCNAMTLNVSSVCSGNPGEAEAPAAMDTINMCLHRNRLQPQGSTSYPATPTNSIRGFASPQTAYHTAHPLSAASTPDSKGDDPLTHTGVRRVLQTSDKENWALTGGKGSAGLGANAVGMGAIELEYRWFSFLC